MKERGRSRQPHALCRLLAAGLLAGCSAGATPENVVHSDDDEKAIALCMRSLDADLERPERDRLGQFPLSRMVVSRYALTWNVSGHLEPAGTRPGFSFSCTIQAADDPTGRMSVSRHHIERDPAGPAASPT
jgi:hypothetical protein